MSWSRCPFPCVPAWFLGVFVSMLRENNTSSQNSLASCCCFLIMMMMSAPPTSITVPFTYLFGHLYTKAPSSPWLRLSPCFIFSKPTCSPCVFGCPNVALWRCNTKQAIQGWCVCVGILDKPVEWDLARSNRKCNPMRIHLHKLQKICAHFMLN